MSNCRSIRTWVGVALVTTFAVTAGVAYARSILPPGTRVECTMPGPTFTGRRWAFVEVGADRKICYRSADFTRAGVAAPVEAKHCHLAGTTIGCEYILDK